VILAVKLEVRSFRIAQRRTFRVSRESYDHQDCVIVGLGDGRHVGYGEATAFAVYGAALGDLRAVLAEAARTVDGYVMGEPAQMWGDLAPLLADHPFARCALDVAAHDLWGKRLGQPLHHLLGLDLGQAPPSVFSLGLDPIDRLVADVEAHPGWPIFKVKAGTDDDVARVRVLRAHTDAAFQVDVNGGWDVETTLRRAEALAELGVTLIEQPLPASDLAGMAELHGRVALPVIADESCTGEDALTRCLPLFDGVNLKLMKCGGITGALRMIGLARSAGRAVHMGCMPETSVGISALANLAPLLDGLDADSIELIGTDVARGVQLDAGRLVWRDLPGCGFEVDWNLAEGCEIT